MTVSCGEPKARGPETISGMLPRCCRRRRVRWLSYQSSKKYEPLDNDDSYDGAAKPSRPPVNHPQPRAPVVTTPQGEPDSPPPELYLLMVVICCKAC